MWAEIELAKRDASEVLGFQDTGPGQSFMICFATQWQLEFAAARGGKAILVDATHSTNQLKVRACNISTANVFLGFFFKLMVSEVTLNITKMLGSTKISILVWSDLAWRAETPCRQALSQQLDDNDGRKKT